MRAIPSLRRVLKTLPDGHACHLIRQFNLRNQTHGRPPSVKMLAELLGFVVREKDLRGDQSGQLVAEPRAQLGYAIEVNSRHSIQRKRWTVLHEMGHYFLHLNKDDPFAFSFERDTTIGGFYLEHELLEEREADEFAAAVLFGDGAFRAALSLCRGDEKRMAKHFGVSVGAVKQAKKQFQ